MQARIFDFGRLAAESRDDVYPGDEALLDVAVRFENEAECYGWNNEAYFNKGRTPWWRLLRGRYLVKVVITSSGQKCIGIFRLVNDVDSWTDFRLLSATAEDRRKFKKPSGF
jgi:hypothetical protein